MCMNRYQALLGSATREPQAAPGWRISRVLPASGLFGANGMQFGLDGRLYVAQAFGSQVTTVNINSGGLEIISPLGGPIVAPYDVAFDSSGTLRYRGNERASVRAYPGWYGAGGCGQSAR